MLQYGNGNRTQHPTDANKESSRSHAVFQVYIKQTGKGSGLSADVKVAKLSMIDLAGSERGSVTSSRGAARFREGANINKRFNIKVILLDLLRYKKNYIEKLKTKLENKNQNVNAANTFCTALSLCNYQRRCQ